MQRVNKFGMVLFVVVSLTVLPAHAQEEERERVKESTAVLKEIFGSPDKGIPKTLMDNAECIVIYPAVKKAGFVVAGSYGRGVMSCRTGEDWNGPWSAPAMYALEGGSIGLQAGAQETDYVLLIMNERGADSVMSSDVKIGGDASAAIGPVGRSASAETDAAMKAQILSYSRARGLFGGVSLAGSTIRFDGGGTKKLYGKELPVKQVVRSGTVEIPAEAKPLMTLLGQISPKPSS